MYEVSQSETFHCPNNIKLNTKIKGSAVLLMLIDNIFSGLLKFRFIRFYYNLMKSLLLLVSQLARICAIGIQVLNAIT